MHTYTHVNLANVPAWRQRMELDQTQLAIAAAPGYTTDLLRPPYSSTLDAMRPVGLAGAAARRHYRAVFTDLDTEDWAKPGVEKIVRRRNPARATTARS